MQIKIRKIKLTNFKGIRSMEISFNQLTNIYGENAAGKTSIFDAFTWCLFGKDSCDRKDFEVKTLDANNQVIPQIEHEVEVELQVELQVINLKRILREKWTKKRGAPTAEFTGNENVFFWNDVPLNAGEFQAKVSGIVDESLFKLITNPLYFNTNMKWQDRRSVLFSMANTIDEASIFGKIATPDNQQMIDDIRTMLNQGKSILEYKKEIASKKKNLKEALDAIPTRVDEANRSMPQPEDYAAIEQKIQYFKDQIKIIDDKKDDITKAHTEANQSILDKQNELNAMKSKVQQLRYELSNSNTSAINTLKQQIQELEYAISGAKGSIQRNENSIHENHQQISQLEIENTNLRNRWNTINEQEFTMADDKTVCPSCLRKLDENKIFDIEQELRNNFNASKTAQLDQISTSGKYNAGIIEKRKADSAQCNDAISKLNSSIEANETAIRIKRGELSNLQNNIPQPTQEILDLENKISTFVIPEATTKTDFTELNNQRAQCQSEIDELNKKLAGKSLIDTIKQRIDELNKQEANYAQQLADLEGQEFVLDSFNKMKIDSMVESVNSKFSIIKFKLFESQINGGEVECCEALVNTNGAWVPYSSANTAGQIVAGIDVINTLCRHHQVYAPIFIDNRESVNELIPCESQIINLIVSTDKQLRIN
jgi:DNA repair exonuclease SbcCD ATPase subunit